MISEFFGRERGAGAVRVLRFDAIKYAQERAIRERTTIGVFESDDYDRGAVFYVAELGSAEHHLPSGAVQTFAVLYDGKLCATVPGGFWNKRASREP